MSAKRIIPCMDTKNGRVVKGVRFEDVKDLDDPVALAVFYNESGADEVVFYDITASMEGRKPFSDILTRVAAQVSIPFTVGGGVNELSDFERLLDLGADKISINSGAIARPELIAEAAARYGSERVVLAMDVKRAGGAFRVFKSGGRVDTGIDALEWARAGQERGAGELVLNSIDTDGVREGFDLEMLKAVCAHVSIPVVASGGAGCAQDFLTLFRECPAVDAGLAASIFHTKQVLSPALKAYLAAEGVEVGRPNRA